MGRLLAKQFSPKDLQGLALWLKADAGTTTEAEYFISSIVVSEAGTPSANGTYSRASGGETSFTNPNGSYIDFVGDDIWSLTGYVNEDVNDEPLYLLTIQGNNIVGVSQDAWGQLQLPTTNTSLTATGNTIVTAWADQSGNGRNASAYNNPQLITNQINGKPVIDFNASQYFTSDNQNLNNNSSIFFVVKSRGDHGIIFSTSDYEGLVFALTAEPNNSFAVGISNLFEIANEGADNGNNWMIGSTIRSNNLTSIIYKNGTQVANGDYDTSSLNPTAPLIIGTDADLNSYWNLDGQIAEIIIYNRALTISERQKVEAYLNQKYAIYSPIPNTKISINKQNLGGGKITSNENYILNSKFDADNQYPIADGNLFFDSNYPFMGNCNDLAICTILGNNYTHNSPLFYEGGFNNYHTFANRTFHEINAPYNTLPIGHPIQPRLLKMFGAGSKFGRTDNLTNYLKTITNTTSFSPSDAESWTKYGVEQVLSIPSWATKVVYGVKYLAKSDDLFRENNFAGLKLNFRTSYFDASDRNYVNIHLIRRSAASAVDTLESLYGSNVYLFFDANSSSNAMCQWLGPQVSRVKIRKRSSTIIDSNTDSFIKIKDTIDIPTFSSSGGEPDFGNSRPEFLSLEMFFAEWVSYLNDDAISSGSIYFYEPFIYFV